MKLAGGSRTVAVVPCGVGCDVVVEAMELQWWCCNDDVTRGDEVWWWYTVVVSVWLWC